jgi:hypothetical protein
MNASYTIRREAEGLPVPFGSAGVAGAGAAILGLIGLVVPVGWIESLSYQLYLDTITSAAAPPLGTTARVLFAIAMAVLGGAAGYMLARLFKVVPSDLVDVLLARLRGLDQEDEADAPVLRSADRHPDAPARRPFSPLRDIPEPDGGDDDAVTTPFAPSPRFAGASGDEEDELLLDGQFAGHIEPLVSPTEAAQSTGGYDAAGWPVMGDEDEHLPPLPRANDPAAEPVEEEVVFDLPAPAPEDWEQAAQPAMPAVESGADDEPEPVAQAEAATPLSPGPTAPARPAAPLPLDLSAARLDELIARLEAGFARKTASPAAEAAEAPDAATAAEARLTGGAAGSEENPAFPHDPALAAALATLRKLNRAV